MEALALIVSIVALVMAILAYQKAGGVAGLKKEAEVLSHVGETIVKATDTLRDKTTGIVERMGELVRGAEEKKEAPKATEVPGVVEGAAAPKAEGRVEGMEGAAAPKVEKKSAPRTRKRTSRRRTRASTK